MFLCIKFIVGIILNKYFKEKNQSFLSLWNDIVLHNSKKLDQACEKSSKKNQHFEWNWYIRLFSFFWTEMLSYLILDMTIKKNKKIWLCCRKLSNYNLIILPRVNLFIFSMSTEFIYYEHRSSCFYLFVLAS